jgi:dimethylaniline monooxygenase (N-oxide forming)|tara:strand:+ start:431 stop:964 length:534 start_codon:yes stop_codon:yes gene_type:complete
MAELQVMWWLERLRGRIPSKRAPPSYALLGKKLKYGVDYGNYMHQLAVEMGAVPSLALLWKRSPRACVAYALGQAYVPFFRLQGPFASDSAWRISATELFAPVIQRGILANLVFIMTMGAFGLVSLAAFVVERALLLLPFVPAALRHAVRVARSGGGDRAAVDTGARGGSCRRYKNN